MMVDSNDSPNQARLQRSLRSWLPILGMDAAGNVRVLTEAEVKRLRDSMECEEGEQDG